MAVAASSFSELYQQSPIRGSDENVAITSDAGDISDDCSGASVFDVTSTTAAVEMALQLTRPDGSPVRSLAPEDEFVLHVLVKDLRQAPQGVFAGYLDVAWNSSLAVVAGAAEYGPAYGNGHGGDFSHAGWIDDAGAFSTSLSPLGGEQRELFSVHLRAVDVGTLVFTLDPADQFPFHHVLVYGSNKPVPRGSVHYRAATIAIGNDHVSENSGISLDGSEELVATSSLDETAEGESGSHESDLNVDGQSVDDATVARVSHSDPFSDLQILASIDAAGKNLAYDYNGSASDLGEGASTVVQVRGPTASAALSVTGFGKADSTAFNAGALDEPSEATLDAHDEFFTELGLEPISHSRSANRRSGHPDKFSPDVAIRTGCIFSLG